MIKDRLDELKAGHTDDDGVALGDVVLQVEPDHPTNLDPFFKEVEEIRGMIDRISASVDSVKKKHSEILSSSQTDEKVKQELDDLMADVKSTSMKVKTKLKGLEQKTEAVDPENNNATQRIKRNQHSTLSRLFVETMTEYNRIQSDYRDRCKGRIQRQLKITGRDTTDEELENMLESGNAEIFTQGIIMETKQARQRLADIEARHEDIIKLEVSIRELHDLFMDMALMVERQGNMCDSIEKHVQQASKYVEEATMQVKKARVYRVKTRKKKIMIIICVIILLAVLALIIGLSVS